MFSGPYTVVAVEKGIMATSSRSCPSVPPFFLEHAHNGVARGVDLDDFPDWLAAQAELVDRFRSKNYDPLLHLVVQGGEETSVLDPVIEDLLVGLIDRPQLHA
ncbi:MAG: hypothetical protein ABI837_17275, partial [Acidobacteriota bacterium]